MRRSQQSARAASSCDVCFRESAAAAGHSRAPLFHGRLAALVGRGSFHRTRGSCSVDLVAIGRGASAAELGYNNAYARGATNKPGLGARNSSQP